MARSKEVDGQQDLIDVEPTDAAKIKRAAREFKKAVAEVNAANEKRKDKRKRLIDIIKASDIQHEEGQPYKFRVGSMVIDVTPRDDNVSVKDGGDDEGEENEGEE